MIDQFDPPLNYERFTHRIAFDAPLTAPEQEPTHPIPLEYPAGRHYYLYIKIALERGRKIEERIKINNPFSAARYEKFGD